MPDAVPIQDFIRQAAKKHGVPEQLALAVAEHESSFNPEAIGPEIKDMPGVRAIGTFQLLPSTAKSLGVDPNDPAGNIDGGVRYLRQLLDASNGDLDLVLKRYGGFKTVDPTSYITKINERMAKFGVGQASGTLGGDMSGAAAPPPAGPAAGSIATGRASGAGPAAMQPPVTAPPTSPPGLMARAGTFLSELGTAGIVEPIKGIASLASTAYQEGVGTAAKAAAAGILTPVKENLELATRARQANDPQLWLAHMLSAIPIYGPVIEEAGVLLAQGEPEKAAGRAIGGLVPIRGAGAAARTAAGPAAKGIAKGAEWSAARSMAKLLRAAGDGSPAAEKALQQVVPLALDRSILRATRGGMEQAAGAAKRAAGQRVGETVAGPVGDVVVPVAPVLEGLGALRQQITNYVPIDATGNPIGAGAVRGAADLKAVAYNTELARHVTQLEDILQAHGPTVQVRQLVNLRRDWDDFVYKSKSWLNREDIQTQYGARAKAAATDAIRSLITNDQRLVTLAEVDKAYSLHSKLYAFIADETFGKGHGLPYYPGVGLKSAITRKLFDLAVRSPSWRLTPIRVKMKLARAMAGNNESAVRTHLREIIGGGAVAAGREPENDLLPAAPPAQISPPAPAVGAGPVGR